MSAAASCSSVDRSGDPLATAREAITNGKFDVDDPEVGAVTSGGRLLCTGVLIAPRVAVTAAHCVQHQAIDAMFFGSVTAGTGDRIRIAHSRLHPAFDGATLANDVALILLSEARSTVSTKIVPRALDATWRGASARIVGFGRAFPLDRTANQKLTGTAKINEIASTSFTLTPDPSLPCDGDSGGPAWVMLDGVEYLAGVISWGDPDCSTTSTVTRVDQLASFIDPYIAAVAEGASRLGERCFYSAHCASGSCIEPSDVPDFRYCSTSCASDADCPLPMTCLFDESTDRGGQCRHAQPSPGALGAKCSVHDDCQSELCSRWDRRMSSVCAKLCFPDIAETCSPGYACRPNIDLDNQSHGCFVDAFHPADGGSPDGASQAPSLGAVGEGGCSMTSRRGAYARWPAWSMVAALWAFRGLARRTRRRLSIRRVSLASASARTGG